MIIYSISMNHFASHLYENKRAGRVSYVSATWLVHKLTRCPRYIALRKRLPTAANRPTTEPREGEHRDCRGIQTLRGAASSVKLSLSHRHSLTNLISPTEKQFTNTQSSLLLLSNHGNFSDLANTRDCSCGRTGPFSP